MRAGLLGKPGRGSFQDLSFFAKGLVLPPQPAELLALVGRQAVRPLAHVKIGLGQPAPDGLGGRLELLVQPRAFGYHSRAMLSRAQEARVRDVLANHLLTKLSPLIRWESDQWGRLAVQGL
jgi:hypothetical protein